jgi:hypothetical protein
MTTKFCPFIIGHAHALDKPTSPGSLECMKGACGLWDATWFRCGELTKAIKLYDIDTELKEIKAQLINLCHIEAHKK